MTLSLTCLFGMAILTASLTYRDPELDGPRRRRFGLASFWLLLAATVAVIARDTDRWGATAVMAAACIGTAGRPLLLMNVVHLWPADKEHLQRRATVGVWTVIVTVVVVAFWLVPADA